MNDTTTSRARGPAKPRAGEPIRLYRVGDKWRYRCTIDVGRDPVTGKRRQATKVKDTLTAARSWVTATKADVAKGTYLSKDPTTLDALCDDWLASRSGEVREITVHGYRGALLPVRRLLGARQVQSLTVADIERLRSWLAEHGGHGGKPLGVRSVGYSLTTLRMVLDRAITAQIVTQNVAKMVKSPRSTDPDGDLERWDAPDVQAFLTAADADPWAAGWRLSVCGMRRSEVLGLDWRHVDLDAGTVTVAASRVTVGKTTVIGKPKSRASARTVPVETVAPGTVNLLRRLHLAQGRPDHGLVLTDPLGEPVLPDHYSRRFREIVAETGLPAIHLHALRHTAAYALHQSGISPADASALLGHGIAVHLAVYTFARVDGVRSAAAALGRVYGTVAS